MKKILVVSDTHGICDHLLTVMDRERPFQLVLHAGDVERDEDFIRGYAKCPMYIVRGNCDYSYELPYEAVAPFAGHKIFITHGHRYQVYYGLQALKSAAAERGADIVVFGHTHVPCLEEGHMTVMNPGSLTKPRQIGHEYSYGTIEFEDDGTPHFSIKYL